MPIRHAAGWTIATGDVRAIATTDSRRLRAGIEGTPVAADTKTLLGGSEAVMSGSINWGNSEAGGLFFGAVMDQIGHLLGLGH